MFLVKVIIDVMFVGFVFNLYFFISFLKFFEILLYVNILEVNIENGGFKIFNVLLNFIECFNKFIIYVRIKV